MAGCSLTGQLKRCHSALDAFGRCIRGRDWHQVSERSGRINREMQVLRMQLLGHTDLSDDMAVQVQHLDIHLRRLQRQLSMHINAVEEDVATLGLGIKRAETAKLLLHS